MTGIEWYTLNKKLVKVGQVVIKGGSSLVNHLVDQVMRGSWVSRGLLTGYIVLSNVEERLSNVDQP